jgi:hypothetical protein
MSIFYDIGLVLSLLMGGVIGLLLAKTRFDQMAMRHRQYEAEVAQYLEVYAALALGGGSHQAPHRIGRHPRLRPTPPGGPA